MTAIAIVPADNAIVISSDGARNATDGTLAGVASKVVLMPEASCVIAQRGAAGIAQAVAFRMGHRTSMEAVLRDIVDVSREVHREYALHYRFEGHWSMFISGWSDERQRFSTYVLRSRRIDALSDPRTGEHFVSEPFVLEHAPGIISVPVAPREVQQQFGYDLLELGTYDAIALSQRMVCAARFAPRQAGESDIEGNPLMVGCFLQTTIVQKDSIFSQIVHRWPDPDGELIDPNCGEPMPAHLVPLA